ncbi:DNA-3-methyladenine glycosylase family protein [Anaeropeptidivorans aminofermentans]|uniref:DNA-3-methyladenine glycosylase family protein n=1 Tax=Anaeropeptidivorans aminofermentans TaxID=2934315 RepID=UPI0020240221|nr:DNA glycosylase [Anaeropeptidivorans aminofermentans]
MELFFEGNKAVMTNYNSFDIEEILECGQCFRFDKLGEKNYIYVAGNRVLHIEQNIKRGIVEFYPTTEEEFKEYWLNYFDFNRNYEEIKDILKQSDDVLSEAINFAGGIRILNQDFWDCLIAFVISQNNRIPRIKQVIKNISEVYGKEIDEGYYSFPEASVFNNVTIEKLMECKTGFRAKYILDAAEKRLSGRLDEIEIRKLDTENLRKRLMEIYGVGGKVADCVLIFSLNRPEVFPTDVWIKRVMQHFYFGGKEVPIKDIHAFVKDKWGGLAGFAQQYLFHYARLNRIGGK